MKEREKDDDFKLTEQLEDLSVIEEQAEETNGGAFDAQGRLLIGTEGGIWDQKSSPSSLK